ncbi:hypothetical protein MKEN_00219600 [Mycena kentingensis (nom. inval.)]|nr:hypothetical protein MKEN_00219600 [Mycena kentingensis (nom. inval.)]
MGTKEAGSLPPPTPRMSDSAVPSLDEALWDANPLLPEELELLASQTGIRDSEELKRHVVEIQKRAYEIHSYPCIRTFNFVRSSRIARLPGYEKALALQRSHPDTLLLDIACGFGTEIRKLVSNGFPAENIVGTDLHSEFWELGHELFKSSPKTLPAKFLAGDIFSRAFFNPDSDDSSTREGIPSTLTTLTPLKGKLTLIHAASFFHLFDEQTQLALARILTALLSPESGAMIFGVQVGRRVAGPRTRVKYSEDDTGEDLYTHSPESWRAMWEAVFAESGGAGEIEVHLKLKDEGQDTARAWSEDGADGWLIWSVTRV